ncbi:MAG: formate dehydrogenase subunit gamma [Burkholderiales bacterium]|nr:formate dehydrogenase subunit gamma [Burkholderiales bacterium]
MARPEPSSDASDFAVDARGRPAIRRYSSNERSTHWLTALCFIALALSGLALFHPALFWLTALFGGGPWTRILHPFVGVLMFVLFMALVVRFARHNHLDANDRRWLAQPGDVLRNREERLPPVGRYNAGQKLLFWALLVAMGVMLLTGLAIWRAYFSAWFPVSLVRLASLLHAFFAFLMIVAIVVHVYAAIWIKGSIRAMTRGSVSYAWARRHHADWYGEVVERERRADKHGNAGAPPARGAP